MSLEKKIAAGYAKLAMKRIAWRNKLKTMQLMAKRRGAAKADKWKAKWAKRTAKMRTREARWKIRWESKSVAMDAKASKWKAKWANKAKRFRVRALKWRVKWLKRTCGWNAKWWARSRKYPDIFESDYLSHSRSHPELGPLPEYV